MFLLIFFSFTLITGIAICFISVAKYSTYVETDGEVIDYLKCNPLEGDEQDKHKEENLSAVVISYQVNGKPYQLATNIKKNRNRGGQVPVKVLYNPYLPGESQLKEGTPFLGAILILVSLICLGVQIFFSYI